MCRHLAHIPLHSGSAYASSKAGVEMLTKSGALEFASSAFKCGTPEETRPALCSAIGAAQVALNCDSIGPGEGCAITGCDTGLYCEPTQDICLIQKGSGESCDLNTECLSNSCNFNVCE